MKFLQSFAAKGLAFCILLFSAASVKAQTEELDNLFKKSSEAVANKNYNEALISLQQVLKKEPGNIRGLEETGDVYAKLKNYPAAIQYFKQINILLPDNATFYNNTGWYLILNKEYNDAEKYCLKALSLNKCSYSIYLNLGHIYAFLKQKNTSLEFYKKAASYIPNKEGYEQGILADFNFFEKEGIYPYAIEPYKNMFTTYFNNEYLTKVYGSKTLDTIYQLTSFQDYPANDETIVALKERFLKEEVKNTHLRLYVLRDFFWDLGWIRYNTGSKQIALGEYLINVINISNDLKDTSFIIDALSDVGFAERDLTLLKQALGIAVTSHNIKKQYSVSLMLGDYMKEREQWDLALAYFRQSFFQADVLGSEAKSLALNRLIAVFGVKQQIDSVSYYYALAKNVRTDNESGLQNGFNDDQNYCYFLSQAGRHTEAIKKGKSFIDFYKNEKTIDVSRMYERVGYAYAELNETDSATFFYREAIRLYNIYVQNNPGILTHELPLKARYESFIYLKQIALAKNDINELFSLSELCKANILFPKLTGSRITPKTIDIKGLAKGFSGDEVALSYNNSFMPQIAYAIAVSKYDELLVKEDYTPMDIIMGKGEVNWYEIIDKLRSKLDKSGVKPEDNKTMNVFLAGIAGNNFSNMKNGGKTRGVISDDSDTAKNTNIELQAFNDILYGIYIKPFEKILAGKKTIYISADMGTTVNPFEALKNAHGDYLGSLYNIIYVPSFTTRAILKSTLKADNKKMLALGNPVYDNFNPHNTRGRAYDVANTLTSWSNLPGTGKELESIRKSVPAATIIKRAALTESKIKELSNSGELVKYDVLHFAVHGIGSINDYRDNTLILSEPTGTNEDGFLQFIEIAQLHLKANLVCLSACETAVGLPAENEEVKNLPIAFFMAGARSVIATWWQIDDEASGIFMSTFYNLVFKENKSYRLHGKNLLKENLEKHIKPLITGQRLSILDINKHRMFPPLPCLLLFSHLR